MIRDVPTSDPAQSLAAVVRRRSSMERLHGDVVVDILTRRFGYRSSMTQDDTTTPEDDQDPGTGSGDGGSLGTPSGLPEEAPPGSDQEANEAVSGGGMVNPSTEDDPEDTVDTDTD